MISLPTESEGLDPALLARVPALPGAYRLYDGCRVIYVGIASTRRTLRYELSRHLRGDYGAATQRASAFDFRTAPDEAGAARLYLELYRSSGWRDPAHLLAGRAHGVSLSGA